MSFLSLCKAPQSETFIYKVYTQKRYTMEDILDNPIMCSKCKIETTPATIDRNGFQLRAKKCTNCNKIIYHPLDIQEYEDFTKIRSKTFQVKLRMVGNSYTVSIPREIINYQEDFYDEVNKLINLSLEQPGKVSLFFSKRIRRL